MIRTVLWLCCGCLCLFLTGCGRQEYPGARRFPLSGRVTYGGEPIDIGSISFIPLGSEKRVSGGPIMDGKYSVPEAQGANAGKHRIEIRWQKRTGRKIPVPNTDFVDEERAEGLPAEYHRDSTLSVEVGENQTTFDFDLKSK
jgi:hypothetical protein